ncbi:PorP/SprF family type IX secretion system membrane protein [Saccharicrinis sp. FJH2]|uniref:PorP/SprF family type IX secretion system membrane protein n=1 Tax=Saccharicrinis sp. FJH65 TaxID=3344659 RepID=UPI0035F2792C
MIQNYTGKQILNKRENGILYHILRGITITAFLFFFNHQNTMAQMDPQFSSNMFNILSSNPAAAGRNGQMNVFGLTRQQWVGFINNPQTSVFNFDTNLKLFKQESGVGLSIISDNLGLFNNLSINFIYSYRKRIWNGVLGAGINTGFINLTWSGEIYIPDKGTETDYMTAIESSTNDLKQKSSDTKFDMGFGAFFDHEKFYAGISVSRLTRPELKLSSTSNGVYFFFNRVYYATAGYNFTLTDKPKYEIKPSVFLKSDGIISQADINCNVWYDKKYYGGLSYRLQEGFVVLAGIKLKNGLNIGYAFDLTTSRMKYGTYGSQEVYVSYSFEVDMNKQLSKHKSVRFL